MMKEIIQPRVKWVFKEKTEDGWQIVMEKHNLLTNYGLTSYALAPGGGYVAPVYLVIDQALTGLVSNTNIGDTTLQTVADPTLGGDNQLVVGGGLPSAETVTFTSKTGTGPYTFTLSSGMVNAHTASDAVMRKETVSDTIASVVSEAQFDPTFFPLQRGVMAASFSPGTGQATFQFYFAGTQATNVLFSHAGLADTATVGTGNLHNYATFGYYHNNTNDVEIDITYTLTTS